MPRFESQGLSLAAVWQAAKGLRGRIAHAHGHDPPPRRLMRLWPVVGLEPTIALIPASPWRLQVHDYTGRLIRALGKPPLVVSTHWDLQSAPYGASQDVQLEQAEVFVREVKKISPKTKVVIPRHFETVQA